MRLKNGGRNIKAMVNNITKEIVQEFIRDTEKIVKAVDAAARHK